MIVKPRIHPLATVQDGASVIGDVTIGQGCRVMSGARIVAEGGGSIVLGDFVIVLENAVIRATMRHPTRIGSNVLVGPNTHIVGAHVEDEVFIATGASVFHGSHLKAGAEVRINAVVHIRTTLEPGDVVPIGWIAIGTPAEVFSPDRHEEISARQRALDFPRFVYGVERDGPAVVRQITEVMAKALG